jgi:opacity protein-like surface antigen
MINIKSCAKTALTIILFAFCVIPNTNLFAQDTSVVRGKHALQFQVGSNFNLSSFSGTTFSYKYQADKNTVYRLGVSVSGNSQNSDITDQNSPSIGVDTLTDKTLFNQNADRYSFKISADYLFYNNVVNEIAFYYGAGPFISYLSNNNVVDTPGSELYKRARTESNNSEWELGLNGICGVDWFFSKNMSLSAEYSLSVYYLKSKATSKNINGDLYSSQETKNHGFVFGSNPVKLGISFYF